MSTFYIAAAVLAAIGALMMFSPETCARADAKDDPEALKKIAAGGKAMIGFAGAALLLALKYTLF